MAGWWRPATSKAIRKRSIVACRIFCKRSAVVRRCRKLGGCRTGDAKTTPGFRLPAKWVIHTVGPVWSGGGRGEDELLRSCYRRCFQEALAHGAKTIALPAISTGAYRYPIEAAAPIAIAAVLTALDRYPLAEIRFVLFSARDHEIYRRLLAAEGRLRQG